jgi:hypothetical protein
MTKLYDEDRDAFELDKAGGYYSRHVIAMTKEGLHNKSDIVAELAYRDMVIDGLKAQVEQLRKDSLVAFGDGFYDGYLHYAKLCGDDDFIDNAIRQSELAEAESIYGKKVGSSVRVAEIKAQAVAEFADEVINHFECCNYNLTRQTLKCYLHEHLRQQVKGGF